MSGFTLASNDFQGQVPKACVFNGMGAGGDNESPQLSWTGAPEGTKSYLLVCHDDDAPTAGGFWHWAAINIPVSAGTLQRNASADGMPDGTVQLRNDYGMMGYGGACPPPGDQAHAYLVTLYALSTDKLDLGDDTPPAKAVFMAQEHVLGKAGVVAYYAR